MRTKNDEVETPDWLFQYYNKKYNFALDAAANIENSKCSRFFSKETNGLKADWANNGWTWCNPPYSRTRASSLDRWVSKAIEEDYAGRSSVLLILADTSTTYFRRCIQHAREIHFWNRIKFKGHNGSPNFRVMAVVFNKQSKVTTPPKFLYMHSDEVRLQQTLEGLMFD